MDIELVEVGTPVNQVDISKFAEVQNVKLPIAYERFLLRHNGGRPIQATFKIDKLQGNQEGKIHFFFGINFSIESYDLILMNKFFRPGMPDGIVVIACTAGIDYICLDLRGSAEKVVYWAHAHYWGTGEWREQDFYDITPTFLDLIQMMNSGPDAPA